MISHMTAVKAAMCKTWGGQRVSEFCPLLIVVLVVHTWWFFYKFTLNVNEGNQKKQVLKSNIAYCCLNRAKKIPRHRRQISLSTNLIRLWIKSNESSEILSVEITLNHIVNVKSLPAFHWLSWDWQHPGTLFCLKYFWNWS